jgi:hypothetical protein
MFLLWRNAFSDTMITPPAPALPPPSVAGALAMPGITCMSDLPRFCVQVIRDHRNRGVPQRQGRSPPRASKSFEDFNRAKFSFFFGIMMP